MQPSPSGSPFRHGGLSPLHPLLELAAEERLPSWARCTPERCEHIQRVRQLVIDWGTILNLAAAELARWKAAATLHDAMRDADPAEFGRDAVYPEETGASWPQHLLHGPACAFLLRSEGIRDVSLLRAVAYHTTGHADLDEMGEYLYLADFLDPGRDFLHEERQAMRDRLPGERASVLMEVIGLRIGYLIDRRSTMLPETLLFWNRVVEGGT